MSNPNTGGPGFWQENGHIVFPILGILGGSILLISAYTIWRGPHRSFLPDCLHCRLRRNSAMVPIEDEEKRLRGLGLPRGSSRDDRFDIGTMAIGGIGRVGERNNGSWSTAGSTAAEDVKETMNEVSLLQYRSGLPLTSPFGLETSTPNYPSPPSPALMSGTRVHQYTSNSVKDRQQARPPLAANSAYNSGVKNGDDSDMW